MTALGAASSSGHVPTKDGCPPHPAVHFGDPERRLTPKQPLSRRPRSSRSNRSSRASPLGPFCPFRLFVDNTGIGHVVGKQPVIARPRVGWGTGRTPFHHRVANRPPMLFTDP